MIKMVYLIRRAEEITHEEYVRHLLEHHVPLALRHHPAMRRYTVSPIVPGTPGAEEFDAVAELYFDSMEDFEKNLYDSPEGEAAIAADLAGFIGPDFKAYVTEELVFKDELGTPEPYRPGTPVPPLGGEILPGAGWAPPA